MDITTNDPLFYLKIHREKVGTLKSFGTFHYYLEQSENLEVHRMRNTPAMVTKFGNFINI